MTTAIRLAGGNAAQSCCVEESQVISALRWDKTTGAVMHRCSAVAKIIGFIVISAAMASADAQNFPNKPIRIVTSGAGGSSDLTSRLIAQGITGPLAQQVIVDNRPSGVIPGQVVSQAAPDGYTLLVAGNSLWVGPLIQ